MMKLTQIQRMLLAAATARDDGQLFPLPGKGGPRRDQALQGLIDAALIAPVTVVADEQVWRVEGDARLGLLVTAAGRDLIAAEQDGVSLVDLPLPGTNEERTPSPASLPKIKQVLALLERDEGATLDELGQATDWLPHSVRAALSGLRKKGHRIERRPRGSVTTYVVTREG